MKEILFAFKANRLLNEDDLKKIENLIEKSNYSIKDKLISIFPNKAKTVVYVIKESHLIFQEYPEFNLLLGNYFCKKGKKCLSKILLLCPHLALGLFQQ